MNALTWLGLVEEADIAGPGREDYPFWTEEEIHTYEEALEDVLDLVIGQEPLERIIYAQASAQILHEQYTAAHTQERQRFLAFEAAQAARQLHTPKPQHRAPTREVLEDTPVGPTPYEDDYVIDWSQPVIFRGESRNGDGRLFYLYVPWGIVPGDQLRSFLREHVGVAKGYKGMKGIKLGRGKFLRTLPLAGQVNKQPVSYIDRTIEALLAHGAEKVQERRVVNIEELCTGSCQGANSWTPCECVCGGDGHGGGSVLPGTNYTVYRGDLIIEGKRQIVWKIYE